MRTSSLVAITLFLSVVLACRNPAAVGVPAAILIVSGDLQTSAVGAPLPEPLVVRVVDRDGHALPGQPVVFQVTSGGGSVLARTWGTSGAGESYAYFTLGSVALDTQLVTARVPSDDSLYVVFRALGVAGPTVGVRAGPRDQVLTSLGDTIRMQAWEVDRFGNPCGPATVGWRSSDPAVALVDPDGWVTAMQNGTTSIVASLTERMVDAVPVVVRQSPATVRITPDSLRLSRLLDTARAVVDVRDARGNPVADADIGWVSTAPRVAAVSAAGLVTAVASGVGYVRVSVAELRDSIAVAVDVPVVVVDPDGIVVRGVGGTAQLGAVVRTFDGGVVSGATFAWTSLHPEVATVDALSGLVTGVRSGQAVIAARADDVTGYALVTVNVRDERTNVAWQVVTSPTTQYLSDIWGAAPNDVWAWSPGWAAGRLLHYDGASWTVWGGSEVEPGGFWGVGANDVWRGPRHFDGATWTLRDAGLQAGSQIGKMWGSGPKDVWAGVVTSINPNRSCVAIYNGVEWVEVETACSGWGVLGIWGSRHESVWLLTANGNTDTDLWHFDRGRAGYSWLPFRATGIWGSGQDDVWVVGSLDQYPLPTEGRIAHYDGSGWTTTAFPSTHLTSVFGSAADDVWATGMRTSPPPQWLPPQPVEFVGVILHFDGTAWTPDSLPAGVGQLNAGWCGVPDGCWVVGNNGTILRR